MASEGGQVRLDPVEFLDFSGAYRLEVRLDPEGLLEEMDKTNNLYVIETTVSNSQPCTGRPENCSQPIAFYFVPIF